MPIRRFERIPWKRATPRRVWRRLSKRRLLYWALIASGIFLLAGAGTVLWWSKDLPNPQNINSRRIAESTKIFDRTGTQLLYEIGEVHRTTIPLDQISPSIRQATIAAEDATFYQHHGLDLKGIARAILVDIRGGNLQGGSTITQQLIKNAILTPEKTLRRKVKEAALALELEQRFTKDQILEMYLNDIPYGSQAYGVEAASQAFFGTSARQVTLAQAAILAALPKAPTYYSPYGSHFEDLKRRQEYILDRMVSLNMTKSEQAEAAKKETIHFQPRREAINAPHFVFYVKEQLEKEYGDRVVEQGGLRVTTTLDGRLQRLAEETLKNKQAALKKAGISNAALVAIDPKTGDIVSMVGSIDYFDESIDGNVNVAIRHRSPGSSIKPFVYATAWQRGYSPNTLLVDAETDFGQGYKPKNYDLKTRGPVTMRTALANSLNIPAVQTLYLAGVRSATELAVRMGMDSLTDPDRYGLSLVLGGGEVRLVDETSAYGVFANDGLRHPHRSLLKVEDGDKVLFDATKEEPAEDRVIDPQIARLVSNVLSDNAARSSVFGSRSYLQLGSRPVAAKTGTTQEFRDGWTLGYTPSLVAGVWVGNNDNSPMTSRDPGSQTAAPIWNEFMRSALSGTPIEQFTPPAALPPAPHGILRGELPEAKGKLEPATNTIYTAECPIEAGPVRTFKELHSLLFYVQRTNPLGPPPAAAEQDPQFQRWEAAVAAWRDKHNSENKDKPEEIIYVNSLPTPACEVGNTEDLPKVKIVEPDTTVITNSPVKITVEVDSPQPLKEVRFLLDGQDIGVRRPDEPFVAAFSYPPTFSGRKTLLVLAITENNLVGRAHRAFIINPDDSNPTITLHTPQNGAQLTAPEFPQTIKVTAVDASGIELVDILYQKEGAVGTTRIARVATPTDKSKNRYEGIWPDSPGPGVYTIYAIAYDKTGNSSSSQQHTITVE